MSTDISHPLAVNSCLTITIHPNPPIGNHPEEPSLYVARNILAFTFFDPLRRRSVMIWDWTTSDLLLVRQIYLPSCDLFNQNLQDSTVALDPSLPPVRNGHRFSLIDHTYCLFLSPVDSGSIRLYKFIRSSGVTSPAIHLVTLHLPPISTGISAIATTKSQAGPIMAQATSHIPLVTNDEDRLHLLTLVYRASFEGPPSPISTNMFVHQRVFMNYIAQAADSGAGPPLDIPWAEWGPQNTRIIYPGYILTSRWQNRCAGARVAMPYLRR
jgi:hypothetical protein